MTCDPPGRISSVEILSPVFSKTSPSNASGRGRNSGRGLIFGPLGIVTG